MSKSTLYLAGALALASGISAELNAIPEATTTFNLPLDQLIGVVPLPTKPPSEALVRRQSSRNSETNILIAPDSICGYIDGNSRIPFSCLDQDFSCVFITAEATRYGNVACCNTQTCGVRVSCYDQSQISTASICDTECMLDPFILKCSNSAQPYCNTISFSSDIMDYWCNSFADTSTQTAFTTYPGQTGRRWTTVAAGDEDDTNTVIDDILSDEESTTSSRTTSTPGPASGDDDDDDSTPTPEPSDDADAGGSSNDSSGGSSTPVGPIVGGVVGGVAVLAAVGFGIWFILRRKKKEADAPGNPPMQQAQNIPPQGPPPGPYGVGGIAPVGQSPPPHQSYYDPSKGGYMQPDYQGTPPPGYPPQPHQQQHLTPGPYYANTIPDRHDTTSPSAVSQSNASMHRLSAVSPGSPGSQAPSQFMQGGYAPQGPQGHPQQPGQPTIYEAPGPNDGHHRGQMHEMA